MGIARCDRLAVDEAIFIDASVDRVAVGGPYITATVGLYVPARILIARKFIIGVFAVPRLRRFNRSGINDIDLTFSHDDMFYFKSAVHFAQQNLSQAQFHQPRPKAPDSSGVRDISTQFEVTEFTEQQITKQ
jgi:hypothetical protein